VGRQFHVFAQRCRVVRYDLRGYGRSSRPEPGVAYSHVRDLAAVLDAAKIDRAAIVGCSIGGAIALDFALTHPDRVTALVVAAAPLGGLQDATDEEAWFEERLAGMDDAVRSGDLEGAAECRCPSGRARDR
jgi:3-oxoadipate enol-lactonase